MRLGEHMRQHIPTGQDGRQMTDEAIRAMVRAVLAAHPEWLALGVPGIDRVAAEAERRLRAGLRA